MPQAKTEDKLEASKDRLRTAFAQLEDVVEKKIKLVENRARAQVEAAAKGGGDISVIRQELDSMKKQIEHLEQEKEELQMQLGKEKELIKKMRITNREISGRVDNMIGQVKEIMKA